MNLPEYYKCAGTLVGEIHNEVYSKYGETAYKSAHFGWHTENVDSLFKKMYSLIDSPEGVKFLIANITYEYIDVSQKDPITREPINLHQNIKIVDSNKPIKIEFEWKLAGIPFITKQEADNQNLSYNL